MKAPPPQFNTQIHSYILSYALSTCGAEYQYKLSQEALTWTFAIPILLATSLRHNVHMINYTYLKYTIKIFWQFVMTTTCNQYCKKKKNRPFLHLKYSLCFFTINVTSFLAVGNLSAFGSHMLALYFLEFQVNGITQYMLFWLASWLHIKLLRSYHLVHSSLCINEK